MINKSLPLKINFVAYEKIQVIGHSEKAKAFYHRIKKAIGNQCRLIYTDHPDPDCDLSLVVDMPFPGFDETINSPAYISEEDCYGLTSSQKYLQTTDWLAMKAMERQLVAMNEAGIWSLPDDVLQIFKSRERSRNEVDREIQDSLNERDNLSI